MGGLSTKMGNGISKIKQIREENEIEKRKQEKKRKEIENEIDILLIRLKTSMEENNLSMEGNNLSDSEHNQLYQNMNMHETKEKIERYANLYVKTKYVVDNKKGRKRLYYEKLYQNLIILDLFVKNKWFKYIQDYHLVDKFRKINREDLIKHFRNNINEFFKTANIVRSKIKNKKITLDKFFYINDMIYISKGHDMNPNEFYVKKVLGWTYNNEEKRDDWIPNDINNMKDINNDIKSKYIEQRRKILHDFNIYLCVLDEGYDNDWATHFEKRHKNERRQFNFRTVHQFILKDNAGLLFHTSKVLNNISETLKENLKENNKWVVWCYSDTGWGGDYNFLKFLTEDELNNFNRDDETRGYQIQ